MFRGVAFFKEKVYNVNILKKVKATKKTKKVINWAYLMFFIILLKKIIRHKNALTQKNRFN